MMALSLVVAVYAAATRTGASSSRKLILTGSTAIGMILLLAGQWLLAASGVLRMWDRTPPPLMLMFGLTTLATLCLAFSPVGTMLCRGLPLGVLVGSQAFRFPLELVMHGAATEGTMPVQMSYSGYNFDIVTGVTAILVAALIVMDRAPRALVVGWNLLGSLLLLVIVGVAVASLPPIAAFGPDHMNEWVAFPPFVWLPGVLVQAAVLGHTLIWRKLFARQFEIDPAKNPASAVRAA